MMPNFYTKSGIIKNTGFVKPKITKEDFRRGDGKLGAEVINPTGQWDESLPVLEPQNLYFETFCCTVWNTIKCLCILAKRKFGEIWDKAERYNSVLAGIQEGYGGSPHNAAESIRKLGVVEQSSLPWTSDMNTFKEFASPKPMTQEYLDEGRRWLRSFTFGHEWVYALGSSRVKSFFYYLGYKLGFKTLQEAMMDALQYSPLGVSVYAWIFDSNGLAVKQPWQSDNHWTCCYGYVKDQYWLIYDSYLKCFVKCAWNYPFGFVKRYSLDRANFAEADAEYIKDKMNATNVKGDLKSGIYFIYGGQKLPYPNMTEYNNICDKYFKDRNFTVVAQDALDLIEEGNPRLYDNVANEQLFISLKDELNKNL